ncbi:MAG: hypothetical protein E7404_05065 [Ruminococcaceae bacterium]|nr:hypothetical protein [Oscillospiraceae bacterium]
MTNATLDKNMIELLKNLKNTKFISYECGEVFNLVGGNLKINTDKISLEITNFLKEDLFFDENEEFAVFECKKSNSNFKPYCDTPLKNFDIEENIVTIEIINDFISVNNGKYKFSYDQAIIIKTVNKTIMFSRDVWFSEVITISDNDNYDAVFPISEVKETFSNFGEYEVEVKRRKYSL